MGLFSNKAADAFTYGQILKSNQGIFGEIFKGTSQKIKEESQEKRREYESTTSNYKHLWVDYYKYNGSDAFALKDKNYKTAYSIRLKTSSNKQIYMYNSEGEEIACIKVKSHDKFKIYLGGREYGKVKRGLISDTYYFEINNTEYELSEETIRLNGNEVAKFCQVKGAGEVLMYTDSTNLTNVAILVLCRHAAIISENEELSF